jgi:hypothetical protein
MVAGMTGQPSANMTAQEAAVLKYILRRPASNPSAIGAAIGGKFNATHILNALGE